MDTLRVSVPRREQLQSVWGDFARGLLTGEQQALIRSQFDDDLFVAEQIGVPPLYEALYRWSDGPTACDHCWHEFVGFQMLAIRPYGLKISGDVESFLGRVLEIRQWDGSHSPHLAI